MGTNDGMMHAFDDSNGTETFAYVPHDMHRDPANAGPLLQSQIPAELAAGIDWTTLRHLEATALAKQRSTSTVKHSRSSSIRGPRCWTHCANA